MSMRVLASCFALMAVGAVSAATIPSSVSKAENALLLNKNDNGYDTSLTNSTKWTSGATGGTVVTPCLMESPWVPNPAAAEKIFVIPSGKAMRTYKVDAKNKPTGYVAGKPLVIGGQAWHCGGSITPATSFSDTPLCFPPLHVYDDAYFQVNTVIGLTNTEVIVHASQSKPFTFKGTSKFKLHFKEVTFRSSDDMGADAGVSFSFANNFSEQTYYLQNCDFSGFTGQLALGRANNISNVTAVIEKGDFDLPGSVELYTNSCFKTRSDALASLGACHVQGRSKLQVGGRGAWSVGDLTMDEGTSITIQDQSLASASSREPVITVTNRLVLPPSSPIRLDFSVTEGSDSLVWWPLVRLAAGVRDAADNPVRLTPSQFTVTSTMFVSLEVTEEDGVQTLWAKQLPTVTLAISDSISTNAAGQTLPKAIQTGGGERWSDGKDLHADVRYLVSGAGKSLYFSTDFTFPDSMLDVQYGTVDLQDKVSHVTVSNLVLGPSASVRNFLVSPMVTLDGKIKVTGTAASPAYFYQYQQATPDVVAGTLVASEIEGSGVLELTWRGKDLSYGRLELTGLSTNFTGKMKVCCYQYQKPTSEDYTPMSAKFLRVWVHDQRNLGGPIPNVTAPVYDALTVRDRQMLWVTNALTHDVVFDEPSRGIYVPWWGRFGADADTTFTIKQQVTYAGRLQKVGAGTLALGGTAKFTSAVRDTPYAGETFLAGTNVLDIAEGALKPLSTAAFAGVAVVFSNNTSLVLDPQAEDAGVAAYGLKSVGPGSSVSVPEGTVNVRFAGAAPAANFTCPVATFATEEAANAFRAKLSTPKPWTGWQTTLSVEAKDELYVVTATAEKNGMMLLFR